MQYRRNYPDSIDEVLDPPVRFRRQTVTTVTQFARMRPWRGTLEQRMEKFRMLHVELCAVYGKTTVLTFRTMDGGCSGSSHYDPRGGEMVLTGRLPDSMTLVIGNAAASEGIRCLVSNGDKNNPGFRRG